MANEEHIRRLKQGIDAWNAWRRDPASGANLSDADLIRVDLINANLNDANLSGADLIRADLMQAHLIRADLRFANVRGANLRGANLNGARLRDVNLTGADLRGANLSGTNLFDADLSDTDLSGANLSDAYLIRAHLIDAKLTGANLTEVTLSETIFVNIDLTNVFGLERCDHQGPSVIDHRTIQKSGSLPVSFLRGVGLPDRLIDYLPSFWGQGIQYYSCFISYSAKDQDFANRIHADLQNKGVRCWFAPHDLPIGEKILDGIDAAIRLRDKVLLILSEHSIRSEWVEDEVTKAFEEERKRGQNVLFPIRLDDAVMTTDEPWVAKLAARNIGDFLRWRDHDGYKQSFDRVLRDLKAPSKVT